MKNRPIPSFLVILVILTLACNTLIGPTSTPVPPAILHFENDIVAFDYPQGMDLYEGGDAAFQCNPDFQLGGELVVGLGGLKFPGSDYYFRSIRIFRQPIPSYSNLETIMQKTSLEVETIHPRVKGADELFIVSI